MKLPRWIIPVVIVILTVAAVQGSKFIRIPSAEMEVSEEIPGTEPVRGVFIVEGVTCRDTAVSAMENAAAVDGVLRLTAYASHNRIDVAYDPARTGPQAIRSAIEGPVYQENTGEFVFNLYRVVEINGVPVPVSE
ncbi:MAG TPA: hypothetical protein PLV45_01130 [bacterium]|nr:hypothetical protein [bacterium]